MPLARLLLNRYAVNSSRHHLVRYNAEFAGLVPAGALVLDVGAGQALYTCFAARVPDRSARVDGGRVADGECVDARDAPHGISRRYVARTADFVAMQLEYSVAPRANP